MSTRVKIGQLIDSNFFEKCSEHIENNINLQKTTNIEDLKKEIEEELEVYTSHLIEKVLKNNSELDTHTLTQLVISVCEEKYQSIIDKLLKDRGLYKTSEKIILAPLETEGKNGDKITPVVLEENDESAFKPSNEGTDMDSVLNSLSGIYGKNTVNKKEDNIIIPTKDVGNVTFNGFDL